MLMFFATRTLKEGTESSPKCSLVNRRTASLWSNYQERIESVLGALIAAPPVATFNWEHEMLSADKSSLPLQ